MFIYKMRNMQESSSKYGNCEICHKYVPEVWTQTIYKTFIDDKGNAATAYCNIFFGHLNCLKRAQKH